MQKIKGLRQKQTDGTFNSLVPFGTDGILVDMLSGLDSEEEFKIGGNHSSTIVEENGLTTIEEIYTDLDSTILYKVISSIQDNNDDSTTITVQLKKGTDETVVREKTITIPADSTSITIEEVLS